MQVFIDESGDFNIGHKDNISVIAAVIVPENKNYKLVKLFKSLHQRVVLDEKDASGEIKGYKLTQENIKFVFQFLERNLDFRITLVLFDHSNTTNSDILEHRRGQADRFRHGKELYSAGPAKGKQVLDFFEEKIRWAERSDLISDVLYIQLSLQVQIIQESLKKILVHYYDESYRRLCFNEFTFIIDQKNKKIKKPEKYISELIFGFLETVWAKREPYIVLDSLGKEGHPFRKFDKEIDGITATDLKKLLGKGLAFEDSKNFLGLQLADIVASGFRRIAQGSIDKEVFNLVRSNAAFFQEKWQTLSIATFCLSGAKTPSTRRDLYKFLQEPPDKIPL